MQLSDTEKQSLRELAQAFRYRFGAVEVVLYGSAAKNEMDAESDIDLFVVLPQTSWKTEKEMIRLCFEKELECGRIISPVCFSTDELRNGPLDESPLVKNVRKEGIAI